MTGLSSLGFKTRFVTSDLSYSIFKDSVPTLQDIKYGSITKSYQLM
jgi:hypothetical protein